MTNTNKFSEKTKEGFTIWQKTEDGKLFHFVQREERINHLAENDASVTVKKFEIKKGIVIVKVVVGWRSDFFQGIGSCKISNPNTEPTLLKTGLLIQSHLKISDPKSGEILLKKRA